MTARLLYNPGADVTVAAVTHSAAGWAVHQAMCSRRAGCERSDEVFSSAAGGLDARRTWRTGSFLIRDDDRNFTGGFDAVFEAVIRNTIDSIARIAHAAASSRYSFYEAARQVTLQV